MLIVIREDRTFAASESGMGLLQVIMLGAFISMVAVYFASRTVAFQKNMVRFRIKDQIVNDRNILKFDLVNRPFPAPMPSPSP